MEDNIDNVVIFCDLSAAFDTLDHAAIMNKLRIYGFSESSVEWYRTYLSNRAQYCQVAGCNGTTQKIKQELPQGSLPGPQIFNVVFGDVVVCRFSNRVFMVIYADDLTIKIKLCGYVQLDKKFLNRKMSSLQRWMDTNKLLFNPMKTEVLVLSNKNHNMYKDLKLTMNGQTVTQKTAVRRMLGLYLTWNLRNDYYIYQMKNILVSSLNHRLNTLRKLRHKCGPKQFKILSCSIFILKLLFGICFYWQTTEVVRDKICLLLNNMVHLIEDCRLSEQRRLKTLYYNSSTLTADSLCAVQDLNLLWSIQHTSTPEHIANRLAEESRLMRDGPVTRSRSTMHSYPLTRSNQGITWLRSEAFLSRALRRANQLDRSVYIKMGLEDSKQKQRRVACSGTIIYSLTSCHKKFWGIRVVEDSTHCKARAGGCWCPRRDKMLLILKLKAQGFMTKSYEGLQQIP